MKKVKYLFLVIAIGVAALLQAQPVVKASFYKNTTCGPNVLAVAVVLKYDNRSDEVFNIGSSSIFINYNTNKLSFLEYEEAANFDEHCYDASKTNNSQNSFINISIDDVTANTQFSAGNNQHLVGYVFFNLTGGENISNGDVYYNEYFTSFNNQTDNDGTAQLNVVFDNTLIINTAAITCPSECVEDDPILINNITRSWIHACTVDDGRLTLDWPDEAYYNDLHISTDGGQTFVTSNAGQSSLEVGDLPAGDYDLKVKIGANGCVTTLDDINIRNLSHQVTRSWGHATCGQSDGWLQLTWVKKGLSSIDISIDGGLTYKRVPAADELYRIEGLTTGDYDIWVKWSYAPYACPTQLDDINIKVKKPTIKNLDAVYFCEDKQIGLSVIDLFADKYQFKYRTLEGGVWSIWENSDTTNSTKNIRHLTSSAKIQYKARVKFGGLWSAWSSTKINSFVSCRLSNRVVEFINLYPNPANNYVKLTFIDLSFNQSKIIMYDLSGKQVKEKNIVLNTSDMSLDVSDLNNGVYLLKIIASDGKQLFLDKLTIAH